MSKKRSLLSVLILVLTICLTASIALAQDVTPEATSGTTDSNLTYTVTAQGEITNDTVSQTWSLQTASADRITVHVERTSGNLIPDVTLLDSNNQQITTSYGSDYTYATADISDYTLPAGGNFQIVVQRKDGASGVTTGSIHHRRDTGGDGR